MRVTDTKQLEYLHDAIVSEIAFLYTDDSKDMRLTVTCDEDAGYSDWSGKSVVVTLMNIIRASGVLLGHVAGHDIVDSFGEGASADMQQGVRELRSIGIVAPKTFLRLTLRSGSELEIACDEIDISVDWAPAMRAPEGASNQSV